MGIDVEINGGILLVFEDAEDPETIVLKLKKWIKKHPEDVYGWKFEYNDDQIGIEFNNPQRGPLNDYIIGISKFLKYCLSLDIFVMDTLRYMEAWGDYAMGCVWISSEKEASIIRGMTNFGDCIDETIEWKNI